MKTVSLTLKRKVLVIELPEGVDMGDPIQILKHDNHNYIVYSRYNGHMISRNKLPEGSYTLLGSPDDLKEEDVKDLVKKVKDYHTDDFELMLVGNSPMITKINKRIIVYKSYLDDNKGFSSALESFNSALEKEITKPFDFKRTLIFIENEKL